VDTPIRTRNPAMKLGITRVSHGKETIVVVPVIVEPVQVQVTLQPVIPEIEHMPVAVHVP